MAKKKIETFESISKRISDLRECEPQTPEIMKEIDELTEQLEDFPRPEVKAKPVNKSTGPAFTHEEWKLEKTIKNGEIKTTREKLIKRVIITSEHESILNQQKENTLLEYVPIKK